MEFNVNKIRNKTLVKYPYFGTITTNVTFHEDNSIPTACTDGFDIYYSTEFMNSLTVDQQVFVIAHEISHIAFNHINRRVDKDPEIWNIATDAVINAFLMEDRLPIIEGGINMPWASKFNAEELYGVLKKNKDLLEKIIDELKKQNPDLGKDGKSYGSDPHSKWGQQQQKSGSGSSKDKKEKSEEQGGSGNDSEEERRRKKRIENEQKELGDEGEKKAFDKNKDEKKDMLEKMKEDINDKTCQQAGNQAGEYQRRVGEIGKKSKLVDWRYHLRESIKFDLDWSYKNASIEDGVLRANLEGIPRPEVEIVLDTSGSIDEELLKNFLRECKNIMTTSKVKVGCFDTKFYGFHEIRNEYDIEHMPFEGGGGTDFDVAVNAFSRKTVNRIIFTDGYANMPKKPVRAIWVVIGDHTINPDGGKVIYVDRKQLDKRYRFEKQYIKK